MRFKSNVTDVARNFAEYVNRVAYKGERFILMRGKRPVAELRPVLTGRRVADLPEILASLPRLGADDAVAFADDLEKAAGELNQRPARDPWDS